MTPGPKATSAAPIVTAPLIVDETAKGVRSQDCIKLPTACSMPWASASTRATPARSATTYRVASLTSRTRPATSIAGTHSAVEPIVVSTVSGSDLPIARALFVTGRRHRRWSSAEPAGAVSARTTVTSAALSKEPLAAVSTMKAAIGAGTWPLNVETVVNPRASPSARMPATVNAAQRRTRRRETLKASASSDIQTNAVARATVMVWLTGGGEREGAGRRSRR